jgi:hypothetical protein
MPNELKRTWLVQRLEPRPDPTKKDKAMLIDQTFGMGGGGGQLTDEAWKLLYDIWRFEYMGAAEFEFGAIPKALQAMVNGPELKSWVTAFGKKTVYVVGAAGLENEIVERLMELCEDQVRLKEHSNFPEALEIKETRFKVCTVGWLELNNGFFFTIDKEMHDRFWKFMHTAQIGGAKPKRQRVVGCGGSDPEDPA